jgi:hypothetical protein
MAARKPSDQDQVVNNVPFHRALVDLLRQQENDENIPFRVRTPPLLFPFIDKLFAEKEGISEEGEHDGEDQEQTLNQSAHQWLVDLKDVDKTIIGSKENLSELLSTFADAFDLSVTSDRCHPDCNLRHLSCLGALEDRHARLNPAVRRDLPKRLILPNVWLLATEEEQHVG